MWPTNSHFDGFPGDAEIVGGHHILQVTVVFRLQIGDWLQYVFNEVTGMALVPGHI